MDFKKTIFPELIVINGIPFIDGRGAFARIYCKDEFSDHGIEEEFVQTNLSINTTKGTIRGMHAQNKPCSEAKLVRCVSGRVLDVVVDLRYSSPTFLKYFSIELSDVVSLTEFC
ncbi:MAG TPA: dTDP-4-dehydrorhamnose 3,5-epimerase family protein [Saprospiraceae bacterium]|nr:dTDP-4-dehydrorhamnose 3,5-epimerase family protein [Saprospiraceae bacterium]